MSATMHPSAVRAAGKSAQHIGETSVAFAAQDLHTGEQDEGDAHLGGFQSKAGLDNVFTWWPPAAKGLRYNVSGTGDKLVSSANIYENTDSANVDEFRYIPWGRRPH